MRSKISIKGLAGALIVCAFIAGAGANLYGAAVGIAVFALLFIITLARPMLPGGSGDACAGIQKEIWQDRIEENLFNDNEFLMASVDDSQYVDGRTVHIPNAGAVPNVEVNRVKGGPGADTTLREDTEVTYDIDELTTDPFLITDAEEKELSYSKVDSELYDHQETLNDTFAERTIRNWAPTGAAYLNDGITVNANILRTTGIPNNDEKDAPVSVLTYLPGTTGYRLRFGLYDIRKVKVFQGKQKVPKKGRHVLMSEDAYDQIVSDLIATKYRDNMTIFNPETGELSKIMGYKVWVRATVCTYNNAATPVVNAYGAAAAATDNDAMIFWHERAVSRAFGGVQFYETKGSAKDYGDVYSALVRVGGAKRRKTQVGVCALVQTVSAGGAGV